MRNNIHGYRHFVVTPGELLTADKVMQLAERLKGVRAWVFVTCTMPMKPKGVGVIYIKAPDCSFCETLARSLDPSLPNADVRRFARCCGGDLRQLTMAVVSAKTAGVSCVLDTVAAPERTQAHTDMLSILQGEMGGNKRSSLDTSHYNVDVLERHLLHPTQKPFSIGALAGMYADLADADA